MNKIKTNSTDLLSQIVVHTKYAKYLPEKKRRENWSEIVDRYVNMMIEKYPQLERDIKELAPFIYQKKVLPSMRCLQFSGPAIKVNETRGFNCSFLHLDSIESFSETMYLLLSGCGVGYSVQKHHVVKLPESKIPSKGVKWYTIGDDIEGWAESIKEQLSAFYGGYKVEFDYSRIRTKGTRLVTAGGKAPGHEPLKRTHERIQSILNQAFGRKLTPLECHDIQCHIADSVLSGGIRRSAMISLFSKDDGEMLTCKSGDWWITNGQRGRANNSVTLLRGDVSEEEFKSLWKRVEESNAGEPGFYWTNDLEGGTNPCCFTGGTNILTPTGYQPIGSLVGNCELVNKDGKTVKGKVWSNGQKPVFYMKLSNGQEIRTTPEHRFMIVNGEEIEAKDLGKSRIMPFYTINSEITDFALYGFLQGDGGLGRLKSKDHVGLEIYLGDKDHELASMFNVKYESGKRVYYKRGYNDTLRELQFSSEELPKRELPVGINEWSKDNTGQFLKGLFSANGSIITDTRIALKSTCNELILQVQSLLKSNWGIESYITTTKAKVVEFSNGEYECKENYDLNIGKFEDIKTFASKIGFLHTYKNESLERLIKAKSPMVICTRMEVPQEVFDFHLEDETHWGVVEGLIAHNCEIFLRAFSFCNLSSMDVSDIQSQEDLNNRSIVASFFGTLQAGFTDFKYLRPEWRRVSEEDSLIGVSMTGIASGRVLGLNLREAAELVKETNQTIADIIGINPAARCTAIKPEGTLSCVVGSSSGIHAYHDKFYIRTLRLNKVEAIAQYLMENHSDIVEDDLFDSNQIVVSIPIAAPEGSIIRTESVFTLLERISKFNSEWVRVGHRTGANTNNVSATVSIHKDNLYLLDGPQIISGFEIDRLNKANQGECNVWNEWEVVGWWMWNNRDKYNGLSVLPFDNGSYQQAPFTSCTREKYERLLSLVDSLDIEQVREEDDQVNFGDTVACGPQGCELK